MNRYSVIDGKNPREIVLLKGFPCVWGKCAFCDYIADNSQNEEEMTALNNAALSKVTGCTGALEIINSGSCFELPRETLFKIRKIAIQKKIGRLFFESHWIYRKRLQEMRDFMKIPIVFITGVETFNYDFRERVLNKHAGFRSPEEVAAYFDSACLLVGIQGQTQEMIEFDIDALKRCFSYGTVNIFTENSTPLRRDEALIEWFRKKYGFLEDCPHIDVLYENTAFGVGD